MRLMPLIHYSQSLQRQKKTVSERKQHPSSLTRSARWAAVQNKTVFYIVRFLGPIIDKRLCKLDKSIHVGKI